jgi:DNA-binding MarR family transcriptional regulator
VADDVDDLVARWENERPDLDTVVIAVYERLARAGSANRRALDGVATAFDLRSGELDVLAALRNAGPSYARTPTDLARLLDVSPAGITDRVDRLTARDLVERDPNLHDRRSLKVTLTPHGKDLVDAALTDRSVAQTKLLSKLTSKEQTTLAKLLAKLLEPD